MDKAKSLVSSIAAAFLICAVSAIAGGIDQVHFGSRMTPLQCLTITYRSANKSGSIKWGFTKSMGRGPYLTHQTAGIQGSNYYYQFPLLRPSATIYYSIKDGSDWTPIDSFRTARDPVTEGFSFIAGGDSRGDPKHGFVPNNPQPFGWKGMASVLAKEDVDFCIYLADIVNVGTDENDWLWWYDFGKEFIKKNLIFHSFAGHDSGPFYKSEFTMPGNEKYYSFVYGNVRFICLNSTAANDTTQYNWLISTLSAADEDWIVVWFHRPFFCWPKHPDDMNPYRNTWWKAFDDHGVDVILGGHCHNYIRSKPINLNVSSSRAVAEYGDQPGQGRLEIVSGGFGAPLSGLAKGWFVEKTSSSYHYCKFFAKGGTLHLDVYNKQRILIDSLTLQKDVPGISRPIHSRNVRSVESPQMHSAVACDGRLAFRVTAEGGRAYSIRIVNGLGQTMWRQSFNPAGRAELVEHRNLRSGKALPGGVYTAILRQGNREASRRLVVAK